MYSRPPPSGYQQQGPTGYGTPPPNTYGQQGDPRQSRAPSGAGPPPNGARHPFPPPQQGYNSDNRDPRDPRAGPGAGYGAAAAADPRRFQQPGGGHYGTPPPVPSQGYSTPPQPGYMAAPPSAVTRPPPSQSIKAPTDIKPSGDELNGTSKAKARPLFCVVCASNNVRRCRNESTSSRTDGRIVRWRHTWSSSEQHDTGQVARG